MKKAITVVLALSALADLPFAIIKSFSDDVDYFGKPTTLYQLWLIAAALFILLFSSRIIAGTKDFSKRIRPIISLFIAAQLLWIVTIVLPSPQDFIPLDYDGIVVGYTDYTSPDDEIDLTIKRSVLIKHNEKWSEDEVLKFDDLSRRFSKKKNSFLFWQTGMTQGYEPLRVEGYYIPETLGGWLGLFFTVGPLVVLEMCLLGLIDKSAFVIVLLLLVQWRTGKSLIQIMNE